MKKEISPANHSHDEAHLMRELSRIQQVLLAGLQKHTGMTPSRFMTLRLLADAEHGIGVMDLARKLGVDSAAVTRQLQAFESDGLVKKVNDLKDKRRSWFHLTAKGRSSFEGVHQKGHELESDIAKLFQGDEIRITTSTLKKIRHFLEETADD